LSFFIEIAFSQANVRMKIYDKRAASAALLSFKMVDLAAAIQKDGWDV
jgi:hypothetical protein